MAVLLWLPQAQDDLQRLFDFIKPHSPTAATRAVERLVLAAEKLAEFPKSGRPWLADPDFCELSVSFGARGYVIRYRELNDQVVIVRVWHMLEDR